MRTTIRVSFSVIATLAALGCQSAERDGANEGALEVVQSALTTGIQINCGSSSAVGGFVADTDVSGGSSVSLGTSAPLADEFSAIAGFAPDAVYNTGRSGSSTYTLPGFPVGKREVIRLHFIERQKTAAGQRTFNVLINNVQVLTNYDIFVNAGGANKRVVREFTVGADLNQKITIKFVAVTDQPIVSGIEAVASTLPQATQIAAGQPAIGNFADDVGFSSGGSPRTRLNMITTTGVLHAGPANLYQSQRFGSAYSYTVPGFTSGSTNTVRLHFCETNPANNAPGMRLFNVKINGNPVLTGFDVFAAAGNLQNKAVVREFRAQARSTNDYLIEFQATKDAVTLSGLEVLPGVSWSMRSGMTSAEYQAEFNTRIANGYRLTYVDGYTVDGTTMFSAIFDLTTGPAFTASHNLTAADLQTKDDQMTAGGFHISMLNGYAFGAEQRFAAIWEAGAIANHFQHHDLTSAQYQTEFNTQVAAGFKLLHVSGYTVNGSDRYAPIWEKRTSGPGWAAQHLVTDAQLATIVANAQLPSSTQRIIDLSAYVLGGSLRYTVILENLASPVTSLPWTVNQNVPRALFQQQQLDMYRQGYAPVVVPAAANSSGAEVHAGLWQNTAFSQADLNLIETTHKNAPVATLPSDSIAITKNGRLVFAKAWGTSDGTTPATTVNLYRQASISKSITSIGILKLVEQGKLNLNDKVFGTGGILEAEFPGPFGAGITSITVEQLLIHTSGIIDSGALLGLGTGSFATVTAAIQDAVTHATVVPPPPKWTYSNMGYCILGRIIEKRGGGSSYASWMQANVLASIGVTDMVIGDKLLANRFPNEVVYTPNTVAGAYQWNLNIFDAFGGWIATPTDIARFGVHTTGLPVSSLISPTTFAETNFKLNSDWSVTWDVQPGAQNFKDGDLPPGTQSYVVRHTHTPVDDGILWAGVTNSHNLDLFHAGDELIDGPPQMPGLAEIAVTWPDRDFFLDQ